MKKANKLLACLGVALLVVPAMSACGTQKSENSNTGTIELDGVEKQIHDIYLLAKESGFTGTYEEWLATVKGDDGVGIAKIEQLEDDENGNSRFKITLTNGETKEFSINKGPKGDPGTPGQPGEPGQPGTPGKDGQDGSSITTGVGAPKSDSGRLNDLYIDSATWDLYTKTKDGWEKVGNIKGEKGEAGTPGTPGTPGEPGKDGSDGDAGTPGTPGKPGEPGKDGSDGTSMLTGQGQPKAELGKVGDVYLDETSFDIYKKDEAGWSKFGNIKGQDGSDGSNGDAGTPGTPGEPGEPGKDGQDGNNGASAYELYKKNFGYVGSEVDWLKDLATQHLGFEKEYTISVVYLNGEYDEFREVEHPIITNQVYKNGETVDITLPKLEDETLEFVLASDEYSFKGIDNVTPIDIKDYRAYKNCTIYLYYRNANYNVICETNSPNYEDGLTIKIEKGFDGMPGSTEVGDEIYQNLTMKVISCSDPEAKISYDKANKKIITDKPCQAELQFKYNGNNLSNIYVEFVKVLNVKQVDVNPKAIDALAHINAYSAFSFKAYCIDEAGQKIRFDEAMNSHSIDTLFVLENNEEVKWDGRCFIVSSPTKGTMKIINAKDKKVLFEHEIAIVEDQGGGQVEEGPIAISPQTKQFIDNATVGDQIRLNGIYTMSDGSQLKIVEAVGKGVLTISVKDQKIAHVEKDMLFIDAEGENVIVFMDEGGNVIFTLSYRVGGVPQPEPSNQYEVSLKGDALQIPVGQPINFDVTFEGKPIDISTLEYILSEPSQDSCSEYNLNYEKKTVAFNKCGYYMFMVSDKNGQGGIFIQVINPNLKEPSATFTCNNKDVVPQIVSCDMTMEGKFLNEKDIILGEKVEGNHYMRISAKVPEGKAITSVTVDGIEIPYSDYQGGFYYLCDGEAHVIDFVLQDAKAEPKISKIEIDPKTIDEAKYCKVGTTLNVMIAVYDDSGMAMDLLQSSSLIMTTLNGMPFEMKMDEKGYMFDAKEPGEYTLGFVDPESGIPYAELTVVVNK